MASHTVSRNSMRNSATETLRSIQDLYRRYRNKILPIASIILIILAVILINLLVTQTFRPYFNCDRIFGGLNMKQLCSGVDLTIGPYNINYGLGTLTIGPYTFSILPALNAIDRPLEGFRKFLSWNIILIFALVSLVLAFIASKIIGFVKFVLTPEGRKVVLTNLTIWLFFFVIFCTLFYFNFVFGKQ